MESEAPQPDAPNEPWVLRLYARLALAPALFALLLAAAYLLAWIVLCTVAPGPGVAERPLFGSGSWAEAVLRSLLAGYTPTLMALGRRGAARDLDALGPALEVPAAEIPALRARALALDPRILRRAGLVGMAAMACLWALVLRTPDDAVARLGHATLLSDAVWILLLGWLLFRALAADLRVARIFSEIGARWLRLDLLDPRPQAPLVRWGLRTVLLWAIWFSLVQLFWIGAGPGPGRSGNAAGAVPLLVVALGALVIPVRGVHRRVSEAKRAELERVDAALRRERERLFGEDGVAQDARLANLAAYRGLVEGVRSWPFDVSTLVRLALYLALGLGSWLGGALVERLLDVFLR